MRPPILVGPRDRAVKTLIKLSASIGLVGAGAGAVGAVCPAGAGCANPKVGATMARERRSFDRKG